MPHFYERNIVEIKNEYTDFLINILTPLLYEGLQSMYNDAMSFNEKETENNKEKPSILKTFQQILRSTPKLNEHLIQEETNRIITKSKCAEWFPELIRAVIKSYIVLLTYNTSEKRCQIVEHRFHETVNIYNFIHKCYIECAHEFYNNPELFWHELKPIYIKRNQRESFEIIRRCIKNAIRKILPIKLILSEYLSNDYIQTQDNVKNNETDYQRIKENIQRSNNGSFKYEGGSSANHYSEEDSEEYDDIDKLKNRINYLEDKLDGNSDSDNSFLDEDKIKEYRDLTENKLADNIKNILDEELEATPKPPLVRGSIPSVDNDPEFKKLREDGQLLEKIPKIKKNRKDQLNDLLKIQPTQHTTPSNNLKEVQKDRDNIKTDENEENISYFEKYMRKK